MRTAPRPCGLRSTQQLDFFSFTAMCREEPWFGAGGGQKAPFMSHEQILLVREAVGSFSATELSLPTPLLLVLLLVGNVGIQNLDFPDRRSYEGST